MALRAIKCTQCGADLQMDDQKEFGYCISCGTRIMIQETINIKHSGVVKLDTSANASNCLRLADQAYSINNFMEAYNYYTKVLEYDPDSYYATFRKGLSAAKSSPLGDIKYMDLVQGYKLADEILRNRMATQTDEHTVQLLSQEHYNMTTDMKDFALSVLEETEIPSPGTILQTSDDCGHIIYVALDTLLVLENVCSVIDPAQYEEYNKTLLEEMIRLCDRMSYYHLKYVSGYTTDKNGRQTPVHTRYFIPDKAVERFKTCRAQCVQNFNSLPSNVSTLNSLAEQLQTLVNDKAAREAEVKQFEEVYKSSVQAFWNENAELFAQYKAVKNKTWFIVLGGVGVCAALVIAALIQAADILPYGIGGGVALTLSVLIKLKVAQKTAAKFEDKVFTDDLKQKNSDLKAAVAKHAESIKAVKSKEQEKKRFEATLKK